MKGVWVSRIVFGAEIYSFGLSEMEVREVANEVVRGEYRWEINDVRNNGNGRFEILLEYNETGYFYMGKDAFESLKEFAERLFNTIERELETYALFKRYARIYNNNGRRNGTKEIMEKLGIPVIS